jgi:hypothetical protein
MKMEDGDYRKANEFWEIQQLSTEYGQGIRRDRSDVPPEEMLRAFTRMPNEERQTHLATLDGYLKQPAILSSDLRNVSRLTKLRHTFMKRHRTLLRWGR